MEAEGMSVVLLVEDDPGDQKLMRYAISQQETNSQLKIVGTGEEALEYLERSKLNDSNAPRPNLILLDLNMPGMGGKEFLKRVKQNPCFSDIPVVIISTSDAPSDVQDCYRLKAAGYIQKRPNPNDFKQVIGKLLNYWFATSSLVKSGSVSENMGEVQSFREGQNKEGQDGWL
jgi:CheY-like chemotaxis protein